MKTFDGKALGLALGIFCALSAFVFALTMRFFNYGNVFVELLSTIYIGYGPTLGGALVGAVWAFIDGFIGGAILAWLYNKFIR